MTYFPDLSPCEYFPHHEDRLIAVGWLEGHGHSRGVVDPLLVTKLCRFAVYSWEPVAFGGWHTCSLCENPSSLVETYEEDGQSYRLGIKNLFVPTQEELYVTPSLILHYINTHQYQPPEVFQRAVIESPDPASDDYLAMIRSVAPSRLGEPPNGWDSDRPIRQAPRPSTG